MSESFDALICMTRTKDSAEVHGKQDHGISSVVKMQGGAQTMTHGSIPGTRPVQTSGGHTPVCFVHVSHQLQAKAQSRGMRMGEIVRMLIWEARKKAERWN
jgi:hypothetical protein